MALWLCELFQLTERERYCAGTLVLDTWYCGLTFWTSSSTGGWGCSRSDTSSKICKRMSRKMALCVDMIWGCTPVTFLVPATLTLTCSSHRWHWPMRGQYYQYWPMRGQYYRLPAVWGVLTDVATLTVRLGEQSKQVWVQYCRAPINMLGGRQQLSQRKSSWFIMHGLSQVILYWFEVPEES